jgi:hypothetical protein
MKKILCVCILFIFVTAGNAQEKSSALTATAVKMNRSNNAADNGQTAFGVNIVVLRKIGSKWLIVAHEAAVPDPNMAIQSLDTLKSH